MAGYRQFHTKFWKDEWTIDLDPLKRYLFIYLFSNDLSSISGIYRIPLKVVSNETGLDVEYVKECFAEFEKQKKILYRDNTLWVVSMEKYHNNASPLTQTKVSKDIDTIPDNIVKQAYLCYKATGKFCTDTISIQYAYQPLKAKEEAEAQDKSEAQEENANPPAASPEPKPFGDYRLRVFNKVTGMFSIPGDLQVVLPALDGLYYQHEKDEARLVEYLKPFFQAWIKRKDKDGRAYLKTNPAWLCDWAVSGDIPAEQIGRKPTKPVDTSLDELIRSGK